MKENIGKVKNKIRNQVADQAIDFFKQFYGDHINGRDKDKIKKAFDAYVNQKTSQFYLASRNLQFIGDVLLHELNWKQDSKIEGIFFDLLWRENIPFKFQYSIGPYRVDFLISDFLVFEIDGPQHKLTQERDKKRDKYIEKMGYEIMRMETWFITMDPEIVIDGIKEIIGRGS